MTEKPTKCDLEPEGEHTVYAVCMRVPTERDCVYCIIAILDQGN